MKVTATAFVGTLCLTPTVLAWVTPSSSSSSSSSSTMASCRLQLPRTQRTSLSMFDWLNPNKARQEKEEEKKMEVAETRLEAPPKEEEPVKEEEPSPAAEAVQEEETKEEEPVVAVAVPEVKEDEAPAAMAAEEKTEAAVSASAASSDEIHKGTVRFFDRVKGYGFIDSSDSDETGKQVFVHQSEIQAPGYRFLFNGEKVEYRIEYDAKGRTRALHVTGPDGGMVRIGQLREKEAAEGKAES